MKWFPGGCVYLYCSEDDRSSNTAHRGSLSLSLALGCPTHQPTFGGAPLRRNRTQAQRFVFAVGQKWWMRPRAQIMDVCKRSPAALCKWVDNCRMQICVYVLRVTSESVKALCWAACGSEWCMQMRLDVNSDASREKWNWDRGAGAHWSAHTLHRMHATWCGSANENYKMLLRVVVHRSL